MIASIFFIHVSSAARCTAVRRAINDLAACAGFSACLIATIALSNKYLA